MVQDSNGFITMQQDTFPGSVGDSCAETGRMMLLCYILNILHKPVNLQLLVTPQGVVRYPSPPSPWGPSDTSADQVAPLLAICSLQEPELAQQILDQITNNGFRTGNGEVANPCLLAQMVRAEGHSWRQQIYDISILIQALLLKLPFAWNPNATLNPLTWFVSSANQSANYLNFINFLGFARAKKNFTLSCWLASKIISSDKALAEVQAYYKPEPNSQWILDMYAAALPKIW